MGTAEVRVRLSPLAANPGTSVQLTVDPVNRMFVATRPSTGFFDFVPLGDEEVPHRRFFKTTRPFRATDGHLTPGPLVVDADGHHWYFGGDEVLILNPKAWPEGVPAVGGNVPHPLVKTHPAEATQGAVAAPEKGTGVWRFTQFRAQYLKVPGDGKIKRTQWPLAPGDTDARSSSAPPGVFPHLMAAGPGVQALLMDRDDVLHYARLHSHKKAAGTLRWHERTAALAFAGRHLAWVAEPDRQRIRAIHLDPLRKGDVKAWRDPRSEFLLVPQDLMAGPHEELWVIFRNAPYLGRLDADGTPRLLALSPALEPTRFLGVSNDTLFFSVEGVPGGLGEGEAGVASCRVPEAPARKGAASSGGDAESKDAAPRAPEIPAGAPPKKLPEVPALWKQDAPAFFPEPRPALGMTTWELPLDPPASTEKAAVVDPVTGTLGFTLPARYPWFFFCPPGTTDWVKLSRRQAPFEDRLGAPGYSALAVDATGHYWFVGREALFVAEPGRFAAGRPALEGSGLVPRIGPEEEDADPLRVVAGRDRGLWIFDTFRATFATLDPRKTVHLQHYPPPEAGRKPVAAASGWEGEALVADEAGNLTCHSPRGSVTLRLSGTVQGLAYQTPELAWAAKGDTLVCFNPRTLQPRMAFRIDARDSLGSFLRPRDLALGPDGAVWVTFRGASVLGRLEPDGRVQFLALDRAMRPGAFLGSHGGRIYFQLENVPAVGSCLVSPSPGPAPRPMTEPGAPPPPAPSAPGAAAHGGAALPIQPLTPEPASDVLTLPTPLEWDAAAPPLISMDSRGGLVATTAAQSLLFYGSIEAEDWVAVPKPSEVRRDHRGQPSPSLFIADSQGLHWTVGCARLFVADPRKFPPGNPGLAGPGLFPRAPEEAPLDMAASPAGSVWVVDGRQVTRYRHGTMGLDATAFGTGAGTLHPLAVAVNAFDQALIMDVEGSLYRADDRGMVPLAVWEGSLGAMAFQTPSRVWITMPLENRLAALTLDADGIHPAGELAWAAGGRPLSPQGLFLDNDSTMWVTFRGAPMLGHLDLRGHLTLLALPPRMQPLNIVGTHGGRLYFTLEDTGLLGSCRIPGATRVPGPAGTEERKEAKETVPAPAAAPPPRPSIEATPSHIPEGLPPSRQPRKPKRLTDAQRRELAHQRETQAAFRSLEAPEEAAGPAPAPATGAAAGPAPAPRPSRPRKAPAPASPLPTKPPGPRAAGDAVASYMLLETDLDVVLRKHRYGREASGVPSGQRDKSQFQPGYSSPRFLKRLLHAGLADPNRLFRMRDMRCEILCSAPAVGFVQAPDGSWSPSDHVLIVMDWQPHLGYYTLRTAYPYHRSAF